MADRSEPRGLGNHILADDYPGSDYAGFVKDSDVANAPIDDEIQSASEVVESDPGAWPLLHLTKKPTLTPVPRPHNAVALARSAFADANLPVVNVHVKRKKLELRGH